MSIRIKGKPKKPVKKTNVREKYYGDSLGEAVLYFEERGFDLDDVEVAHGYYGECCDDSPETYFEGKRNETSKEWNARLVAYDKKLAEYKQWCVANKDEIEIELAKRATKAKKVELRRLEREVADFNKIEKKIKKTKATLDKLGAIV